MQEALHWGAYFDGLEAYALGRLGRTDSLWALLAMGAGNLAIFSKGTKTQRVRSVLKVRKPKGYVRY